MLNRNLQHSSLHPPRGKRFLSGLARPVALIGCALITLGAGTLFAAEGPSLKEPAGPPSDFGWMRLPDPADHAVGSKTHLIPVELAADGSWSRQINVDPEGDLQLTVVGQEHWQLDLQHPEGRWLGKSAAWIEAGLEGLGLAPAEKKTVPGADVTPGENLKTWSFQGPSEGGSWRLQVQAPEGPRGAGQTAGFVVVTDQSPWSLSLWSSRLDTVVGQSITLRAALQRNLEGDLEGALEPAQDQPQDPSGFDVFVDQLQLTATAADGSRRSWSRAEGNLDAVLIASAGSAKSAPTTGLSFQVMPELAGEHRFDLRLRAFGDQGQVIERSTSVVVQVIQPTLALAAEARTAFLRAADPDPSKVADSAQRLQIDLPVSRLDLSRVGPEQAMVYAELWGRDVDGLPLPVAWVGGIKHVEDTAEGPMLPVRLDRRWLAKAGARPPYRLQNLRLVDVDSSVPFAAAAELPLEVTAPTSWVSPAKRSDLEPDEAMLFGPRPLHLDEQPAAAKSTPRETIVLVHGYCSGNVWSAYQNPFVQPRQIFADFGQARSNNQFAVELWWQTSGIDHFSTVSHSQGGMASLHLYNYYWSGLDTSLAPRPMQSVGTPFNGSALMNHRAALDAIIDLLNLEDRFCPVVFDLTHPGAAVWQAGIASASRNKAYYYRTRGTLLPCHALTAPIIPGRDDGVVSLQEGVLPGGHDLGIETAQCHTPDMFHPFQLSDANRNVQMAANARIWIPDPIEACATVTPTRPYVPALTLLNASCSTVQSGSIVQYRWDIDRPVGSDLTLYGQNVSTTFTAAGIYHITLTITSTGPTLTDTTTRFVFLSDPGDPL